MKRWMAWALAVALAVSGLAVGQAVLLERGDQVGFAAVDFYGTRDCLEGVAAEVCISDGAYLHWNSQVPLDEPQNARTNFTFEPATAAYRGSQSLTVTGLTSATHTGDSQRGVVLRNYGYGSVLRELVSEMEPGSSISETIRLREYLDAHAPGLELRYTSQRYRCYMNSSCEDLYLDGWKSDDQLKALYECFPLPVHGTEYLAVKIAMDSKSHLTSVSLTPGNFPELEAYSYMDDNGLYVIFQAVDSESGALVEMGYPDGFGLYFIPWGLTSQVYEDGTIGVYPEVSKGSKRFSLEDGVRVVQLLGDRQADRCVIVTLEGDAVWITTLKLSTGELLDKNMLWEYTGTLQCAGYQGLYLVADERHLAAVDFQGAVAAQVDLEGYERVYHELCYGTVREMTWEDGVFRVLGSAAAGSQEYFYALTLRDDQIQGLTEYCCTLIESGAEGLIFQSVTTAP